MTIKQEIAELCAMIEALEAKYETMRLATLEWGKDVDKLMRWSDQHLLRIERLEADATCPHIVSSDEGTSYCALAEQTAAAQPEPQGPSMTDLSPAARAIVAAFNDRHELCGPFDGNWQELCLAAALRELADLAGSTKHWHVDQIRAIAAELEAT